MLALIMLAATIDIRRDAPPVTLDQARGMSPADLGDALLIAGHSPIVEAVVGPEGMLPPPPPELPEESEIKLFSAAEPAQQADFCEKTRAVVRLEPVLRSQGELPPSRPKSVSLTKLYRMAVQKNGASRCEAKRYEFFALDEKLADRTFTILRLLNSLRMNGIRKVVVSIDDQEARGMQDYVRENPSQAKGLPKEYITPITDGRVAIERFPISSISYVRNYVKAWDNTLSDLDLKDRKGHDLEAISLFAGGTWDAGIVLDGGRIVKVRFKKAIPPPF
ncbi:hypothetical protein [Sphingomonas faeni]|uniref:hypothetical protein n=1 Tax=Sphingomonas faeni TaxID=185950 RepID=UPI002787A9A0|nr:hypothetical protein [Sphingomonas faeni]MDQ0839251.1 hypothetical protein [Sphingomonas faeni]